MKFYDVQQNEPEWLKLKRGVPSASSFSKIVTPGKGEYSKSSKPYMYLLLAEKLLGETIKDIGNLYAVERGKLLEPQAALAYTVETGIETSNGGWGTTDDGRYGASPDRRLIGVPGGIEMKCPQADTHLAYWFDGFEDKYHCQRQGQMLVFDWEFIDMYSYFPRLPSKIQRVKRDDDFIAKMVKALDQFCGEMAMLEADILGTGFFDEIAASDDGWAGYLRRLDEKAKLIDAG